MITRPFALLLLPLLPVVLSAADVSGRWRMTVKADWTSIPELACTLSQSGQRLEGVCRPSRGDERGVELRDGRIDGERVSWTWQVVVPSGVTWSYAFNGAVDASGSAMKGSVTLSAGPGAKPNEASFAAQKE